VQDFAHIMIAPGADAAHPVPLRERYLHRRMQDHESLDRRRHPCLGRALLPQFGWVGFDPTNNLVAGDRHIRTAIGRDYADVPPTKGVFRGETLSELSVAVRVTASELLQRSTRDCRFRKIGPCWSKKHRNCRPNPRRSATRATATAATIAGVYRQLR